MSRAESVRRWHRLGTILLLGIASGLPFELTSGTLQLWLADTTSALKVVIAAVTTTVVAPFTPGAPALAIFAAAGTPNRMPGSLDLTEMGFFSLLALPYALKPIWSPLLDRYVPRPLARLGRRRGWILIAQGLIAAGLTAMALVPPREAPLVLASVGLLVAFFSATQDIVVDAYRTDLLPAAERGLGATMASFGYRGGMLLAGAAAPIIAVVAGWRLAYLVMAGLMGIGFLATLAGPTEAQDPSRPPPRTMRDAVVLPFADLVRRAHAVKLLLLVLLYKLGDAFSLTLVSAFLRQGVGYGPDEIAIMRKTVGVAATLVGMAVGGFAMTRMKLRTALLVFGVMQAATNLFFMLLAMTGRNDGVFAAAMVSDSFAGGLGSVAFVAFVTALCDVRFSATQFALLSALAQLGRVLCGPVAGPTAEGLGWEGYFLVSTLVAIPGLVLVVWLRKPLHVLGGDGGLGVPDRPGASG